MRAAGAYGAGLIFICNSVGTRAFSTSFRPETSGKKTPALLMTLPCCVGFIDGRGAAGGTSEGVAHQAEKVEHNMRPQPKPTSYKPRVFLENSYRNR